MAAYEKDKKEQEKQSLGTIWSDVSLDTKDLSEGVKKAKEKLADNEPQLVVEKPKAKRGPKPKPKPIATKTCKVRFKTGTAELFEGQPIEGLTREELEYLKFHKFVK
jgi:hypothetical protein